MIQPGRPARPEARVFDLAGFSLDACVAAQAAATPVIGCARDAMVPKGR